MKDSWARAPATMVLRPNNGNIHTFTADETEGCAILDVISPPYDGDEGRDCHYYIEERSGGDAGGSPIVGLVSGLAGMAHNAQAQAQAQAQGGEAGTGAGAAMGGDESVCYEEVNRDTAAMVSIEAADCERVRSFVFISAAHAPPFVDERYLSTKREAEDIIQDLAPDLRPIILRPGACVGCDWCVCVCVWGGGGGGPVEGGVRGGGRWGG